MAAFDFHRRKTRRWLYAGATLVAAVAFAVVFVASSGAVVSGSPSGFESGDGNMLLDNVPTGTNPATNTDWNCFVGTSNFVSGTPNAKCKVKSGALEDTNPNAGLASDPSWVNGQKMDLKCALTTTGNNQDKDSFTNIAQYNETSSSNHLYLYGASIRKSANGDSSENVELSKNKGTTACPINRTDGDKLLQFAFGGSGGVTLQVLTYYDTTALPSGVSCFAQATHSRPCWANPQSISSGLEGAVNGTQINSGDNGINGATLAANFFSEFGVDLTTALGLSTTSCTTFGQETWESRSSSSFSSNPSAIQIIPHSLTNCGTITIVKNTDPRNIDKNFTYTPAGGTPTLGGGTTFTLNDKTGGTNTKTYTDVLRGSYTVTESDPGTGWGLESLNCSPSSADSTGSFGTQHATGSLQADITLGAGGSVTCTFQNQQLTGAIRVHKVSSKASANLSGAAFTYALVTNNVAGTATDFPSTTGTDGYACVSGLAFGTYRIAEKTAPTGYAKDAGTQDVTVNSSGDCTTGYTSAASNFVDTPLSKIEVIFTSLAGSGVTTSQIVCTKGGTAVAADTENGQADSSTPQRDDTDETFGAGTGAGLTPGVYTCTVDIDP